MFTIKDILETNQMITQNNLDVRTITMGISLRDCGHPDIKVTAQKVYDKITRKAEKLVQVGEELEMELGVPIINKRISVTPVSMVGESCDSNDYVPLAKALDEAGKAVGVNFIGGFSALVDKGYTKGDRNLICSIPEALAVTDIVCSSVSVGSTKCGINMDAVAEMGRVIKMAAERTADRDAIGCAKLVVFCNAVPDNPFMAGAFHGVTSISLRNTLESITTPCSVKASGKADFGRLFLDVITNCDEITTHSSAVTWNIKSSGKRSILRFTA